MTLQNQESPPRQKEPLTERPLNLAYTGVTRRPFGILQEVGDLYS